MIIVIQTNMTWIHIFEKHHNYMWYWLWSFQNIHDLLKPYSCLPCDSLNLIQILQIKTAIRLPYVHDNKQQNVWICIYLLFMKLSLLLCIFILNSTNFISLHIEWMNLWADNWGCICHCQLPSMNCQKAKKKNVQLNWIAIVFNICYCQSNWIFHCILASKTTIDTYNRLIFSSISNVLLLKVLLIILVDSSLYEVESIKTTKQWNDVWLWRRWWWWALQISYIKDLAIDEWLSYWLVWWENIKP